MDYVICNAEKVAELWEKTYNADNKPDWSHILPYYAEEISFRDSVQSLQGKTNFKEMTERLTARSQDLAMKVVNYSMTNNIVFLEWEMSIIFKKRPRSVIYGASRITLNKEGQITKQRDYYDLWGDIFDNIPFFVKPYRKFMKNKFG